MQTIKRKLKDGESVSITGHYSDALERWADMFGFNSKHAKVIQSKRPDHKVMVDLLGRRQLYSRCQLTAKENDLITV